MRYMTISVPSNATFPAGWPAAGWPADGVLVLNDLQVWARILAGAPHPCGAPDGEKFVRDAVERRLQRITRSAQ